MRGDSPKLTGQDSGRSGAATANFLFGVRGEECSGQCHQMQFRKQFIEKNKRPRAMLPQTYHFKSPDRAQ